MAIDDSSDYGDSDDFEPSHWEAEFGGPKDNGDEQRVQEDGDYASPDYALIHDGQDLDWDRQLRVFNWLKSSHAVKPMVNGYGFYVREGTIINLEGFEAVDITRWLRDEGFYNRLNFEGYLVRYFWELEDHSLTIFFEQLALHAPFERIDRAKLETREGYRSTLADNDPIPF